MLSLVKTSTIAIAVLAFSAPAFCQSGTAPGQSQTTSESGQTQTFDATSYGSAGRSGEGFGTATFGGGSNSRTDSGGDQVQVENANGETTRCRPWVDQNCKAQ